MWRIWAGTGAVRAACVVGIVFLAASCGDDWPRVAPGRVVLGPVAPPRAEPATPQGRPETEVRHSPLVEVVPTGGRVVDARVLVISADGNEPDLAAIRQTLGYLGTPHDVLIATQAPPLTASQLATGTHGRYNAVILTTGNLVFNSGGQFVSAFSDAEWQVLATYEATFKVRRAALFTFPEPSYGFSGSASLNTSTMPLATQCTARARVVFPYVNCDAGVTISGAWSYLGTPLDAATVPLLTDSSGRVLAATRAYADGREALVLTYAQAPFLVHSLQLLHGLVSWASRGIFLGERHAYIGVQVDDFLLPDALYLGGTYRMSVSDLQAAFDWQAAKRQQAVTAGMRYNFAFNGAGTVIFAPDALVARAQQIGAGFAYINHTYNHLNLDSSTYAQTLDTLTTNAAVATQFGLAPFSVANLVTPSISGLNNPEAMRAAFDFGVRYLVTDTSQPGGNNPSPNAGILNPHQPQILMIPRRATNLFYNVSTQAEWTAEYNDIYRSFWGRDLSYDEILERESDMLVQNLLKGENDPWMFHQPNLRDLGGGRSLLSDLLDRTFAKYQGRVSVPLIGPTMNELGERVAERMRYNASAAAATVDPDAGTVTVRVTNAATVPVTGGCGSTNELYAGERISYVSLPAGGSTTMPLATSACPGTGGGGGGTTLSLPCAALTVATGSIGPGQTASALTTAELTGTQDIWANYVEVFPSSSIICRHDLPAGVAAATLSALALRVNYRGPNRSFQQWTFEAFDAAAGAWIPLGDNTFAATWVWTPTTFNLPAPLPRFFSGGSLQIRYGTTSNVDASDVDQLLISATTTGGGGTAPVPFSLPASSLAVVSGSIGPGQTAAALATAELTGTTDVWANYVEVFPASTIVVNYDLAGGVTPGAITSLALRVNYRGQPIVRQLWTFEVFDAAAGAWVRIGDNAFAPDWVWAPTTFNLPAPLSRFFSGGRLQVRYGTTSTFDASDIDQLLITGFRSQ
jgi:hypothetical protein